MEKHGQRKYFRLTKAERASIERALDKRESARSMARNLGRSASSITDEVKRNRHISKGPSKGERVSCAPKIEKVCPKLEAWPYVCNGCKLRRYHCTYKYRCEYSSVRAEAFANRELVSSRKGVNAREEDFEKILSCIRSDVARGLSPAQIARGRALQFRVHPSTIYRWIETGYAGMANIELRRCVGYKPRKDHAGPKPTSHGPSRSYAAFSTLSEDVRACTCEMDTVIGRARDTQCILTLYMRPSKVQVCLLLPEKTSSAVAAALDMLEKALGFDLFQQLFGLLLTDNGSEFSDTEALERSALDQKKIRCQVYYCDIRQSQQKAACERNHVELRKILPKGQNISFDDLVLRDMAVLMSHLNSEPRRSLMGATPLDILSALIGQDRYTACTDALGIEKIDYERLHLTREAIDKDRRERGEDPLL